MSIITDFNLDSLSITSKRGLIKELRAAIANDKAVNKELKAIVKAQKAAARVEKRATRIAALEAKLEALRNPVGVKAIKANRKAGPVTVTKLA
jgi:hypothetical protein